MPPETLGEAQRHLARRFAEAGLPTPMLDARLILSRAAGLRHASLIAEGERPLAPSEAMTMEALAARRLAGEPVSRIRGVREFYGRDFEITAATLDPRPDTETLVEAALAAAPAGRPLRILDLGTGSGAILVTLLAERPLAAGVGTDKDVAALEVAKRNAGHHMVSERATFLDADWCEGVSGCFDLIVSNPPYIASADIEALAREVREHDPRAALDGGADGLAAYRAIAAGAAALLGMDGSILVEIGEGQGREVRSVFAAEGFVPHRTVPPSSFDLAGRERALAFCQNGAPQAEK